MKAACFWVKTGNGVCKHTLKFLCVLKETWFPGNHTPGLILVNDLVISLLTVSFSKHGTSTLEDGFTAALLIYAKRLT